MEYVYVLRSVGWGDEVYVGVTGDLRRRVGEHNRGECRCTRRFRPWRVETYVGFSDRGKAVGFERYLKTGSGRAFLRKRF